MAKPRIKRETSGDQPPEVLTPPGERLYRFHTSGTHADVPYAPGDTRALSETAAERIRMFAGVDAITHVE